MWHQVSWFNLAASNSVAPLPPPHPSSAPLEWGGEWARNKKLMG